MALNATISADKYRDMDAKEAIQHLHSNTRLGFDAQEVRDRRERYGYNEIEEKKPNNIAILLAKFWGLTAWLLEAIIIISWFLQKYFDAAIVLALLVLNAIIGFLQEKNTSDAIAALKKRLRIYSRTLRGGKWGVLPSRELVPGDIIRLRVGDFVPADAILVSGGLSTDQSALTGESAAVQKNPDDQLYSGSAITDGEATCIVILTGAQTYFGRTAQLVQAAKPKLHAEEVVSQVVSWLLAIVLLVLVSVFAFSVLQGHNPLDILPLMLILLLGAIPVALPAMFTMSMALGARELAGKGVLVTRLGAPDDAASMDILCVDKTGTMTMNRVAVAKVLPFGKYDEDEVLLYGALASNEANHDPIDIAFISAAKERKLAVSSFSVESFTPFSPKTRRVEALVEGKGARFTAIKGSPKIMAGLCKVGAKMQSRMDAFALECAKGGYRVIAVAKKRRGFSPELAGLVALYDPPRDDSADVVKRLGELGVSVKMLTGDALPVAREIARRVGIAKNAISFSMLKAAGKAEAPGLAEKSGVFAEIYPEDKYAIVRDFQQRGHMVGMTGDGVNDAPALKQAEVGIAVSSATDVAKGAASIVLVHDGLANILEPIRVGRVVFRRINTWIINKITKTVLQVCFIVVAFMLTEQYVISSSAMLLLVFMIDFATISLSTDNARPSEKPDKWNIRSLVKVALVLGFLMVAEALGLLFIGLDYLHLGAGQLNTFSFEILFYFTLFQIFAARERGRFWKSAPSATLLAVLALDMLLAAVLSTVGAFGLEAIPLQHTLLVVLYTLTFTLAVNDWVKILVFDNGSQAKCMA